VRDFWAGLRAIIVKDIVVEFRARQVLPTMVVLGMLIVFILRIVSEAGPSGPGTALMGAAALWIAFLFSGLLAQERSFAVEQQNGCIDGLLMAPLDAGTLYLAKLLSNIIILSIFEGIVVPIVLIAFHVRFVNSWLGLIVVLLLGNFALSGVGTLFSAAVQLTRTRGSLLSIVVLVILMPVMIPASFALLVLCAALPEEVAGSSSLAFVGSFESAVGYMVAFDAIFVAVSWLLFGLILDEG